MEQAFSDGRPLANIFCEGHGLEIIADHLILDGNGVRCQRCRSQLFNSEFTGTPWSTPTEADLRDEIFLVLCSDCLAADAEEEDDDEA